MSQIYFIGVTHYMFRTAFLSIIRSSRLYIQILMMDGKTVRIIYSVTPIK